MPSLFLSHSSADKTFVEKLAKDLEGVGVNVWFDKWEINVAARARCQTARVPCQI